MEIEELINLCKNNNLKAQSELYELYKEVLFILCLKYCKNNQDAEDNLQDSFLEIFKNIKKFNNKGSFEGWIKRITINKAIDKYKIKRRFSSLQENKIVDNILIDKNDIDIPLSIILKFIQSLPDQYRFVFNLYELDNYSHKEIASLLSISIGTSKSNLSRAKQILRKKIINYKKNK